jgi:UDP-N-acetyl-D-mannosaminuronate dehydrogenase
MKLEKNIVAGLGEIGKPIQKLLSKHTITVGFDKNSSLMNNIIFKKYENYPTRFLHICIPFTNSFIKNCVELSKEFSPQILVIHSTISPGITQELQQKLDIPVIYSATRGVHKRMLNDLKKYTKFYAIEKNSPKAKWASTQFSKLWNKCGVKSKKMSDPITLELAKIVVDTSYYGWLINYAQISNMIAKKYGVDYDEMWSFSDEIQKYLGNRPKMFPGFIGGHCVIPNLSLINEDSLWEIDKINNIYSRKVKDAKSIAKKYTKGKQSYDK